MPPRVAGGQSVDFAGKPVGQNEKFPGWNLAFGYQVKINPKQIVLATQ